MSDAFKEDARGAIGAATLSMIVISGVMLGAFTIWIAQDVPQSCACMNDPYPPNVLVNTTQFKDENGNGGGWIIKFLTGSAQDVDNMVATLWGLNHTEPENWSGQYSSKILGQDGSTSYIFSNNAAIHFRDASSDGIVNAGDDFKVIRDRDGDGVIETGPGTSISIFIGNDNGDAVAHLVVNLNWTDDSPEDGQI
jgi:hypothetical protein